jgi:uncharacterized membrane protein YjjP (DUF1212 family)
VRRFTPLSRHGLKKVRNLANSHAEAIESRSATPPEPIRFATTPGAGPSDAPMGPDLPSENWVYLTLELALKIGEIELSSGAGIADVTATIQAVTRAYGLPQCEVDVILTSITICCHRGTELDPITTARVINARGTDYTRLLATQKLLARIMATASGQVRIYDALAEIDRISRAKHPYTRWTATAAWAGLAGAVALLIGGNLLEASIAAIITGLIDRVGRVLNQRRLPFFFQQLVGGAIATGATVLIFYTGLFKPEAFSHGNVNYGAAITIGAALTALLSGLSIVSTVQDAITGFYVTAAGRSVEIGLTSAGLIAGVVLGLRLIPRLFSVRGNPSPTVQADPTHLIVTFFAGAAAAGFFALASYATAKAIAAASAAGALAAIVDGVLLLPQVAFSPIVGAGLAATAVGFAGGIISRRLRVPPVIITLSGLTPLLPGLATYRALYTLAGPSPQVSGILALIGAITTALALGGGAVLGEFLGHPVRDQLGRLERRYIDPRLAGALRSSLRDRDR